MNVQKVAWCKKLIHSSGGNAMKEKYKQEISDIIRELNYIARELDSLSYDMEKEFKGIGESYCAMGIRTLSARYRKVKNELNKI